MRASSLRCLGLTFVGLLLAGASRGAPYDAERLSFSLHFKEESSSYRVVGVFLVPGQTLALEALPAAAVGEYELVPGAGSTRQEGPARWQWTAPARPGLYPVHLRRATTAEDMLINVFVETPAGDLQSGRMHGYRIGDYPREPLRGLSIYERPAGFVEVNPEVLGARLSPHFTLGQFLCKQTSGFPRYVALRERLVLKLEALLEDVNRHGIAARTLYVMSGYRTPAYNAALGDVLYSRHIYGDAADVFVDEDGDGVIDDLNGDGRHDEKDLAILAAIAEEVEHEGPDGEFVGGLGRYGRTASHGPFVHVDARGFQARWTG
jgi:hypothetical protein